MPQRIGRFGILGRRIFVITALIAVLAGAAFLFVPWSGSGEARLELVALGEEARFGHRVTFTDVWVDTTQTRTRVPLVLAIGNSGGEAARPARVDLSVPARFQLRSGRDLLAGTRLPGESLVQYRLEGDFPPIEPGRLPTLLPEQDTLWLEPVLTPLECVVVSDSIPELVAARLPPAELLSEVPIFYSIEGGTLEARQTGLLRVELDPALVRTAEPPQLVHGEVQLRGGGFVVPDTLRLALGPGRSHDVACGPPENALRMGVTAWEGAGGARLLSLELGGKTRKLLMDFDGDGTIERMLWDPDGDGRFEAMRETRIPLPRFLLPPKPAAPASSDSGAMDPLQADTSTPAPAATRPRAPRPAPPPVETPRPDTARALPVDTVRRDTVPPDTTRPTPPDTTRRPPPPDTIVPDTTAPPDTTRVARRTTVNRGDT